MSGRTMIVLAALAALGATGPAPVADESPFVKGLKPGEHEKILYIWTRDADHQESDFLAVVDVDPKSETWGTVIATAPTGSAANEAHHFGYNVDATRIYGGGITTNKLFVYDVETDPRQPRLIEAVDLGGSGYSGPHSVYAVPGGLLIAMLGAADGGGPGALILVDDDGKFKEAYPVIHADGSPGYMYDVGVKPEMNLMLTSSWSHPGHVEAGTHTEHAGRQVVIWDWESRKILRKVEVGTAPFAIRWMHGPDGLGGFTCAALGNSVWYWEDADADGTLEFHKVIEYEGNAMPVDMRVSYDNRYLYVSLWAGGKVVQYDISDPKTPRPVSEVSLPQPNMMKLTPDSRRLYVTNSILSSLDGAVDFGAWLIHVGEEGMRIDEDFHPDFTSFASGPAGPHDMLLK